MKRLLREPLLHFLLLGAGLFAAYEYLDRDGQQHDAATIVVDRDSLLTWLQYRSRAFNRQRFDETLDRFEEEELQHVINDYVREEALYRKAKALGLDRNDYVARLRLIQQLEFVTRGFLDAQLALTDADLQRYYLAHREEYDEPARVTFTHVFFSEELRGMEAAEIRAREELDRLNQEHTPFEEAGQHGDAFPYSMNYVDRDAELVASHFGTDMARALFALEPGREKWRGPFRSPYGYHLVMLARREASRTPTLAEVRARVEEDAMRAARDSRFEQSVRSIVGTYKVHVEDDVRGRGGA